jgi:hypothetical protein
MARRLRAAGVEAARPVSHAQVITITFRVGDCRTIAPSYFLALRRRLV